MESGHKFNLYDQIVCAFSEYPIWPGCIQVCHQHKYRGQHVVIREDEHGDDATHYWVFFPDEDNGSWVSEDRIIRFHPKLICALLDIPDGLICKTQAFAFKMAMCIFFQRNSDNERFQSHSVVRDPTPDEVNHLTALVREVSLSMHPAVKSQMISRKVSDDAEVRYDALLQPMWLNIHQESAQRIRAVLSSHEESFNATSDKQ